MDRLIVAAAVAAARYSIPKQDSKPASTILERIDGLIRLPDEGALLDKACEAARREQPTATQCNGSATAPQRNAQHGSMRLP
mmetsp:Transcript_22352/g.62201  ORF Transcript_22352/g.62201 Transcript_22352/m.62201 type:complete len:82 (+) Transcript_22352:511-756(+)